MKKLPDSLLNVATGYLGMGDKEKGDLLVILYEKNELSWSEVAKLCRTYANRVRRDAKRLGISSRNRSKAQSLALESGKHKHPTKGIGHSDVSKVKISESVANNWEQMSKSEREEIKKGAKKRWDNKSEQEIEEFRQAGLDAVRLASKEGSALEKYLLNQLIAAGYKTDFHKERWAIKERLQLDLFLPELNVAIEIDGPSHFEDIWGKESLLKNQLRDHEKNGLLLQLGCVIIRIRQARSRSLSKKYLRGILKNLLEVLNGIKSKRPIGGNRCIILGEDL